MRVEDTEQWRRQDFRHGGGNKGQANYQEGQYVSLTAEPWSPEAITAQKFPRRGNFGGASGGQAIF